MALLGAGLIYRGAAGRCALKRALQANAPGGIHRTFTVPDQSPEKVYEFWRRLENLPGAIEVLESVESTGGLRSHWILKRVAGKRVEWDAEIVNDRPGRLIEWRSVPGSAIRLSGLVRFKRKPSGGTKVHLDLRWQVPGGPLGQALADRLGAAPEQWIDTGIAELREALNRG
jgi:uncharacterized membrane protein